MNAINSMKIVNNNNTINLLLLRLSNNNSMIICTKDLSNIQFLALFMQVIELYSCNIATR